MSALIHIPELLAVLRLPLAIGVVAMVANGCDAWTAVLMILIVALYITGVYIAYRLDLITREGSIVVRAADMIIQFALAMVGGDAGLLWMLLAVAAAEGIAHLPRRIRKKKATGAAEWCFALLRYDILLIYSITPASGSALAFIALIAAALTAVTAFAIMKTGYGRTRVWK